MPCHHPEVHCNFFLYSIGFSLASPWSSWIFVVFLWHVRLELTPEVLELGFQLGFWVLFFIFLERFFTSRRWRATVCLGSLDDIKTVLPCSCRLYPDGSQLNLACILSHVISQHSALGCLDQTPINNWAISVKTVSVLEWESSCLDHIHIQPCDNLFCYQNLFNFHSVSFAYKRLKTKRSELKWTFLEFLGEVCWCRNMV